MKIALCVLQTHACSESIKTETGIYVCRNDFYLTSNMGCDCPDKRIVKIPPQPGDVSDPKKPCTFCGAISNSHLNGCPKY